MEAEGTRHTQSKGRKKKGKVKGNRCSNTNYIKTRRALAFVFLLNHFCVLRRQNGPDVLRRIPARVSLVCKHVFIFERSSVRTFFLFVFFFFSPSRQRRELKRRGRGSTYPLVDWLSPPAASGEERGGERQALLHPQMLKFTHVLPPL